MFPTHCIEGTPEAEVIPELAQYDGEIISKRRYSAFFDTPLEEKLSQLKPEKLVVCGIEEANALLDKVLPGDNREV